MAARPTPETARGLPRLTDPTRVATSKHEGEYQPRGCRRHQRSHGVVGEQQLAHHKFDGPRAQRRHDEEARLDAEHRRDIGRARPAW